MATNNHFWFTWVGVWLWDSRSVTRLGYFLKFLVTSFGTKLAQIFNDFWTALKNNQFLSKKWCGYFLATFGKLWASFHSNIRAHCLVRDIKLQVPYLASRSKQIDWYNFWYFRYFRDNNVSDPLPWLSGLVCAYHPMAMGSNSKHNAANWCCFCGLWKLQKGGWNWPNR